MAESWRDLIFGPRRSLVDVVTPRRTFDDVVLPPATLDAIRHALALIRKQDLIFEQWGLAERHGGGVGVALHFAGPPGTGKTIAAEAIASALGRDLLVVRYAELESRWVGQTAKHVAAVFRVAADDDAVLLFDEADAIAGRRFSAVTQGYEREANAVVSVLLNELERFPGVVIFATNLAAGIDPAFERRIRTHIRFAMPGPAERERIWRAQLHATRTPLAADVDFAALAERFPRSGGDIKNAVLKAAQMATLEPGPDAGKQIHQRHFVRGMEQVVEGEDVMAQSLYDDRGDAALGPLASAWRGLAERQDAADQAVEALEARVAALHGEAESRHLLATGVLEAHALAAGRRERRFMLLLTAVVLIALVALGIVLVIR